VALFVYRRHAQLRLTLECLQACGIDQLHVFCDGPADARAAGDVAEVRRLIGEIDWIEPVVHAEGRNLGLSESIRSGMNQLLECHEAAIVIEDDVCVAAEFYDYACRALSHYKGVERVAGITGFRYPFDRKAFQHYPYDVFLSPRFSSWGWATWRDRWVEFCFDASSLRRQIRAAKLFRPDRAGADMPGLVNDAVVTGSLTGSWDVTCATNMLLRDQYFVTSGWNMVENSGLSEGTHFDRAPPWELRWEPDHKPRLEEIRFAPVDGDERVLKEYRRFLARQGAGRGPIGHARLAAARWRIRLRLRRAGMYR